MIINDAFRSESEMVYDFIGFYIMNKTLHGPLEIKNALLMRRLQEKFRNPARPCNTLEIVNGLKGL